MNKRATAPGGADATNRRSFDRIPTDFAATCRVPAAPDRVQVRDVSYKGCRVTFDHADILAGSTVNLDLPARTVSGQIAWINGRSAGIEFHRALSPQVAAAVGIEVLPAEAEPVVEADPYPAVTGLSHWIRRVLGLRPR